MCNAQLSVYITHLGLCICSSNLRLLCFLSVRVLRLWMDLNQGHGITEVSYMITHNCFQDYDEREHNFILLG